MEGAVNAEAYVPVDETAARTQHRELVSRLFAEHNRALVSFLTARLHCEQEAFDVAQEAYVRMLQLDQAISFHKAYLFRIAENLATDRIRRRIVRERLTEDDLLDHILHEPIGPERHAVAEDELAEIQRHLADLPPRCRYAFIQHVFMDKSVKEVAVMMGVSETMARRHIVRGIEHCRNVFDPGALK